MYSIYIYSTCTIVYTILLVLVPRCTRARARALMEKDSSEKKHIQHLVVITSSPGQYLARISANHMPLLLSRHPNFEIEAK